jgi:hypothetical protein
MPSPEQGDRKQSAVYWPQAGVNTHGEYTVSGTPQQLAPGKPPGGVRWELGRKESVDPQGNTIAIDGYLHVPFQPPNGSCFWQGTIAQLPNPISKITNLMRVVDYAEATDIKGREVLRVVKLMRVSNVLPTS